MAHRPALRLISNPSPQEQIAFSLVHPRGIVHVPARSVRNIEVLEETTYADPLGRPWSFPDPHVEVSLAADVSRRIWELSRTIVEEPLAIFIGGECVLSPIVREPLCQACFFSLAVHDLAEAQAIAARMRCGTARAELRLV